MITIQGTKYPFVFDNACIRDLGRLYEHKTLNETLTLIQKTVSQVTALKKDQEIPFDLLDFLQNMFFVGLIAGGEDEGQPFKLSKRQVYNAIIDDPELLGQCITIIVDAFAAKEQPANQVVSKKKASR